MGSEALGTQRATPDTTFPELGSTVALGTLPEA